MTPLCTVGYEGRTADEFLDLLTRHNVEIVVDVRERAQSRKRGFSKTALSEALATHRVEYIHIRELGNPKAYRDALRSGWDFEEFASLFRQLLESRNEALSELGEVVATGKTCLLCYEADPATCHRSLVADSIAELADSTIEVMHLGYEC